MRFELEKRAERSKVMAWASPLVAILATVITGGLIFAAIGIPPLKGLWIFFLEPFSSLWSLEELVVKATPLILIGVGLSVSYRANVWNIGAEGQLTFGALCGAIVPILYEGRTAKGAVKEGADLDELFEDLFRERNKEELEAIKQKYATKGHIFDAPKLIEEKARDIIRHYVANILPNGLKAAIPEMRGLILAVDQSAAIYPWELMRDEADGEESPLSTRIGMVRQLASLREQPPAISPPSSNVLVIGDTDSGLPELPAAQAEAQDVARMFGAYGYQVRELLRPQAQRVLVHLFDERYFASASHRRSVASAMRDSAALRLAVLFWTPRVSVLKASRLPTR